MNSISKHNDDKNLRVKLFVYRLFEFPREQSHHSPRDLEFHDLRKEALHQALDGVGAWDVQDWGDTDDAGPHELVELTIGILSSPHMQGIAAASAAWIGLEVAKATLSAISSEGVKALVGRLLSKQKERKISEFWVQLPDGTTISCDASCKVTISSRGIQISGH